MADGGLQYPSGSRAGAGLGDEIPAMTMNDRRMAAARLAQPFTPLPPSEQPGATMGDVGLDGEMGRGGLIGYGARRATESMLQGAGDFAGDWLGAEGVRDAAYAAGEYLGPTDEQDQARAMRDAREDRTFAGEAADAITEEIAPTGATIGASVLAGAAAGTATGVPILGTAAGALVGLGIGYLRMRDESRDKAKEYKAKELYGEGATPEQIAAVELDDADIAKVEGAAIASSALEAVTPLKVMRRVMPGAAQELAGTLVQRRALTTGLKKGAGDALAEGATEVGQLAIQEMILNPEVRERMTEDDIRETAEWVAKTYGREAALSFVAGFGIGGGVGVPSQVHVQSVANAKRKQDIQTLAEAGKNASVDLSSFEDAARDKNRVGQMMTDAERIRAASVRLENARTERENYATQPEEERRPGYLEALEKEEQTAQELYNQIHDETMPRYGGMTIKDVEARRVQVEQEAKLAARDRAREQGFTLDDDVDPATVNAAMEPLEQARADLSRAERKRDATTDETYRAKYARQAAEAKQKVRAAEVNARKVMFGEKPEDAAMQLDREAGVRRHRQRLFGDEADPNVVIEQADAVLQDRMARSKVKKTQAKSRERIAKLYEERDDADTESRIQEIETKIAREQAKLKQPDPLVEAAQQAKRDAYRALGIEEAAVDTADLTAAPVDEGLPDQAPGGEVEQAATGEAATTVEASPTTDPEIDPDQLVLDLEPGEVQVGPDAIVDADGASRPAAAPDRAPATTEAGVELPEDAGRYFLTDGPDVSTLPTSALRPTRARPEGVANAGKFMREAYDGSKKRRAPISVRQEADGTYTVLDGNSTYANAVQAGWQNIPVRVVTDAQFATEAAPKFGKRTKTKTTVEGDTIVARGKASKRKAVEQRAAAEGLKVRFEPTEAEVIPATDPRRRGGNAGPRNPWRDATDQLGPDATLDDAVTWLQETRPDVEYQAAFGPDGELLGFGTNDHENMVGAPILTAQRPGSTTLHNHPKDTPFSGGDIASMAALRAGRSVIVTPAGRYEMEPGPALEGMTYDQVKAKVSEVYDGFAEVIGGLGFDKETNPNNRLAQEAMLRVMEADGYISYTVPLDNLTPRQEDMINDLVDAYEGREPGRRDQPGDGEPVGTGAAPGGADGRAGGQRDAAQPGAAPEGSVAAGIDETKAQWKADGNRLFPTVQSAFDAGVANLPIFGEVGGKVAQDTGAPFLMGALKTPGSITRKLATKGGNAGGLGDVVRGGFIARDMADAERIIEGLTGNDAGVQVLTEDWSVRPSGYVDRALVLRMPNGQMAEVQIWLPHMLLAKDGRGPDMQKVDDLPFTPGHKLYEIERNTAAAPADRAAATTGMQRVYGSALAAEPEPVRQMVAGQYPDVMAAADPELTQFMQGAISFGADDVDLRAKAEAQLEKRAAPKPPRGGTYMGVVERFTIPNTSETSPTKPLILSSTNAKNADAQSAALDLLHERHPQPMASEQAWMEYANDAFGGTRVPMPPFQGLKIVAANGDPIVTQLQGMTPGMIKDAVDGLATATAMGEAYRSGQASPADTASLFMWSFLSRGVSPYVQEGAFLDAVTSDTFHSMVEDAATNGWSPELAARYAAWAKDVIPPGSPGRGTQHNMNAFGSSFMRVMSQKQPDGRTGLQTIHDMIADGTPSKEIRRTFLRVGDGAGIDNKVVSFTLLLTGRDDVLVLDRIQMRNQFDDGRFNGDNIYDPDMGPDGKAITGTGIAELSFGHKGLVYYEAMEDAMRPAIDAAYRKLGRGKGSAGRYHWDSWLAASNQEVGHSSVEGLLRKMSNDPQGFAGTFVRQGKFNGYDYGFKYTVMPDGSRAIIVDTPEGGSYTIPNAAVGAGKPLHKALSKLKTAAVKQNPAAGSAIPWTEALTPAQKEDYRNAVADQGSPVSYAVSNGSDAVGRPDAGGASQPDGSGDRGAAGRSARGGARRLAGGGLAPLAGAPTIRGHKGPIQGLVEVAERYAEANGIPLVPQGEFVDVDPARAKRIADAYEAMPHAPNDPAVKEAYADLIRQTRAQYDALADAGYEFFFFAPDSPYGESPATAMEDIRLNRRMGVFPTAAGFGSSDADVSGNPLNEIVPGLTWPDEAGNPQPVYANDLFRAVHDAFGHGLEGSGFRAKGEENAWQAHIRLFTGAAKGAITTETRGQNSWLNYGPYAESNRTAAVEDTVFADQKTGLMPEWTWTEGLAPDAADGPLSAGQDIPPVPGVPTPLYVRRDVVDDGGLRAWAEAAGIEGLVPPNKQHLTVTYSRAPVDVANARPADNSRQAKALGTPMMLGSNGDTLVMPLSKGPLQPDHNRYRKAGASHDYGDGYLPHITLKYGATAEDLAKAKAAPKFTGTLRMGREVQAVLAPGGNPTPPSGPGGGRPLTAAELADAAVSHGQDMERVGGQVRDVLSNKTVNAPIALTQTPPVLRALLGKNAPTVVPQSVVWKANSDKHGLTGQKIIDAIDGLFDPVMVFDSATTDGGLVAIISVPGEARPVAVALHPNQKLGRLDITRVASIHAKDSAGSIPGWMKGGLLRYSNKRKAAELARATGVKLPTENTPNKSGAKILQHRDVFPQTAPQSEPIAAGVDLPDYMDSGYRDTADHMRAAINVAKNPGAFARTAIDKIEDGFFNGFAPIRRLETAVRGKLMEGAESAYKAAEMAVNDSGRQEALLHYGAAKLGQYGEFTIAPGTKGLRTIFDEVVASGNGPQALADWMTYMAAQRAKDLNARGITTPLSAADIATAMAKETPAFKRAAADWKAHNDANIDFLVDTGRITAAQANAMKADAHYVPFYRSNDQMADGSSPEFSLDDYLGVPTPGRAGSGAVLKRDPGIKKIVGGDKKAIDNLLLNMVRNSQAMVAAGMRNDAANKTFDLMEMAGMARTVKATKTSAKTGKTVRREKPANSVRMWIGGKEKFVVVDESGAPLVAALGGLNPRQRGVIESMMIKVGAVFRQGITITPSFMIRNAIRGAVSTGIMTSGSNITAANNTLTGFVDALRQGDATKAFKRQSGMGDYRFGSEDAGFGANDILIDYGMKPKTIMSRLRAGLDKAEYVGTATELADRVAAYKTWVANGVRPDEAAYQALTIMNYGRRGSSALTQIMVPMVPFLNARLQGLSRMAEGAVGKRGAVGRQEAMMKLALNGAVLSMASMLMWAWNNDDDERREKYLSEPTYRRLNFHPLYIGDTTIYIPKAFELGSIFSSIPELMADAAVNDMGDQVVPGIKEIVAQTLLFNAIPAAVLPTIEAMTNYSFFRGGPIEGQRETQLRARDRITGASPLSIAVGQKLGISDATKLSPAKIEHYLQGYGGAYYHMLSAAFEMTGQELGLVPSTPMGPLSDVPVASSGLERALGSIIKADRLQTDKYVEEFYKARTNVGQIYLSAKEAATNGDVEYARNLLSQVPGLEQARTIMNRIGPQMSDLNAAIRITRLDKTLSRREKADKLAPMIAARNELARRVTEVIKQIEEQQGAKFGKVV